MQAAEKHIKTYEILRKQFEDDVGAVTLVEMNGLATRLNQRLAESQRSYYKGEELNEDADDYASEIESRRATLETLSSDEPKVMAMLGSVRCANASEDKDPDHYPSAIFKQSLDECFDCGLVLSPDILTRYMDRCSHEALKDIRANVRNDWDDVCCMHKVDPTKPAVAIVSEACAESPFDEWRNILM